MPLPHPRLALAVSAVLLVGGLAPLAGAAPSAPVCPPLTCATDAAAVLNANMLDLETKANDHYRFGLMTGSHFGTAQRVPGDVHSSGGYGDAGGLWTGVYLGGQAMRYATAKSYLESGKGKSAGKGKSDSAPGHNKPALTDEERAYWTAQRDEALARVRGTVTAFNRSVNIAAAWQTETKNPTVYYDPTKKPNPQDYRHLADFGGGVIKGEPGMLMRACTPVGERLGIGAPTNDDHRVIGPLRWTDGKDYWCEGSPSRDTYAGVTFGMLTAFDLVSGDDPAMRDMLRADLLSMGNFLVKHGWTFPRPWGKVSTKHDFDNAISAAYFAQVPMARLNLTNAVRQVVADGNPADKQKWDGIWAEESASQLASGTLLASMEVDSLQPNDGYYKFNLHHLTAFNLLRTTTGTERAEIARAVAVMDKTTGDDGNAHFEAITFAVTGEQPRLDAAVTHLQQWLDYRATIETGELVDNKKRCGPELSCVRQDQYELQVDGVGDVTYFPGQPDASPAVKAKDLRAARPLPVALRPPTDFLWQRPPTQLNGQEGATAREPGIEFLTPYWMIRYFSEAERPDLAPFPKWAGPAHA